MTAETVAAALTVLDDAERRNLRACEVWGIDIRHLLFARWLLWTGRIDEGLRPESWKCEGI